MTAEPHSTVRESNLSSSLNLGLEFENGDLNGLASLAGNHFDGDNRYDTLDQNFSFSTRINSSEQTSWSLTGSYLIDSTQNDELSRTGVVLERTQRNNGTVSVDWKRRLFEKTTLSVGYEWSRASYVDPLPGIFNYHSDSETARLTHQLNEKCELNMNVSYSVYQIPDQHFLSWDASVRAGSNYSFLEYLKGSISGGFHRTGSDSSSLGTEFHSLDSGWVLSSNLAYQMERLRLQGGYSREVKISGGGALVQVDLLSADLGFPITERAQVTVGLDSYWTNPFGNDLVSLISQYRQFRCGWNWQWMERWEVGLGYTYSTQSSEALSQSISSNAGYFNMSYTTPKWSVSR